MTDMQNEVFKTPVNKIRLFEHGAPGSQNLKLTRKYYTEDMPDQMNMLMQRMSHL